MPVTGVALVAGGNWRRERKLCSEMSNVYRLLLPSILRPSLTHSVHLSLPSYRKCFLFFCFFVFQYRCMKKPDSIILLNSMMLELMMTCLGLEAMCSFLYFLRARRH